MTMYVVDYALDDEDTIVEDINGREKAERRARYISQKHHRGGYEGPLVYVFRKYAPAGQKVFFGGVADHVDGDYA